MVSSSHMIRPRDGRFSILEEKTLAILVPVGRRPGFSGTEIPVTWGPLAGKCEFSHCARGIFTRFWLVRVLFWHGEHMLISYSLERKRL